MGICMIDSTVGYTSLDLVNLLLVRFSANIDNVVQNKGSFWLK